MTRKTKIRPIVRAAFKVDELYYQFDVIDIEDGHLETASLEEVSEKYSDERILADARYRLDIANDEYNQEDSYWRRDARQLRRFIKKGDTPLAKKIAAAEAKRQAESLERTLKIRAGIHD